MNGLYDTPKKKDLIYDVGMHKGEDTEFYLRKGFRVVAFEADPILIQFCRNRLKDFIDQGQLTIIEGAIVAPETLKAEQTNVRFYRNDDVSVWGTVCDDWSERNQRLGHSSTIIEVAVIDLVSIMQHHGIPHYMKIDIEGLDMVCVNVLSRFRERPDYVSIESAKTSFAAIKHEIVALTDLGYTSFQAIEQSSISYSQVPPVPAREGVYVAHRFEHGSSGLFGSELAGKWKTKQAILRQYRIIRLGYYLLGDDGIAVRWKFVGVRWLLTLIGKSLGLGLRAPVPGWYDTHARHVSVDTSKA
ncbi:MAG: FkbM family methyltransferase [Dehalococcoidia bacterium]|jgi:FkbM family methyltransferase